MIAEDIRNYKRIERRVKMVTIKSKKEIEYMEEACRVVALTL